MPPPAPPGAQGYLPFFSVSGDSVPLGPKVGASLLSPTAFALAISLAGTYEDGGIGVRASNLPDITSSYSMSIGEAAGAYRVG